MNGTLRLCRTMKSLFGLAVVCVLATLANCEDCIVQTDCQITQCGGGNSVVCEIPNDGGTGKCTCATPEACGDRNDCFAPEHPELNCDDAQRHCYDSRCVCSVFGGGGSIGGWPGRR